MTSTILLYRPRYSFHCWRPNVYHHRSPVEWALEDGSHQRRSPSPQITFPLPFLPTLLSVLPFSLPYSPTHSLLPFFLPSVCPSIFSFLRHFKISLMCQVLRYLRWGESHKICMTNLKNFTIILKCPTSVLTVDSLKPEAVPYTSKISFCPLYNALTLCSMQQEDLDGCSIIWCPAPSSTR